MQLDCFYGAGFEIGGGGEIGDSGCGICGARGAGAGEEIAFAELGLAGLGRLGGVDVGDCEFGGGGGRGERVEGEGRAGVGDCCVGRAGVVEEGDFRTESQA